MGSTTSSFTFSLACVNAAAYIAVEQSEQTFQHGNNSSVVRLSYRRTFSRYKYSRIHGYLSCSHFLNLDLASTFTLSTNKCVDFFCLTLNRV
mmetsp:Transcript_50323/g.105044  ORF Transcript_50323/g.105044 Transcript_50323/m.105044 type:complete len:92 (+) Transcript_50323:247-522(+)